MMQIARIWCCLARLAWWSFVLATTPRTHSSYAHVKWNVWVERQRMRALLHWENIV